MKYNKDIEREQLNQLNELLILFMKEYPKKSLYLTAIGNSISNAFSIIEPGPLLLDRNLSLIDVGKKHGIVVKKNHLTRSENNNSLTVADWIQNNYSEQDSYNWNIEDYKRHIANGNPLLTETEINKYFKDGNNDSIKDIIFDANHSVANIVILNLGTGSFLDIFTRHGSITPANIIYSLNRDIRGISAILELIQNNNRKNKAHTQVYLCGAPKIANTAITDLAMNPAIKKIGKE